MPCYIISLELKGRRDYEQLYSALKDFGTWARITESTWAIVTSDTAKELREHLMGFLAEEDRIFIVKSGVEAAWKHVRCKNEWLKKHL